MILVSNASPLVNLARIGCLDLVRDLFGSLFIPEAVWHEVVVAGSGQPGAQVVQGAQWIARRQVANHSLVQALQRDLDPGEAEAIALALEVSADLLLMDERVGREAAEHLGLRPMGVIGLLIEAKRRKRVEAVKPLLDALRDRAGFRISGQLYTRILADTGEEK